MIFIITILLNLLFAVSSFAEEGYILEKIVVKRANAEEQRQAYPDEVLPLEDLHQKKIDSIPDILDYVPGIDLRNRSAYGTQADISIRGSTYEQVAMLIDGIRINDMQTGHHNMDIPLTSLDIEKIEVIKKGSSSLYGNGALSGSINIVTKKPVEKSSVLVITAGQHALHSQAFSLAMPKKNHSNNLSFEHKSSNGARPNTDFDQGTFSYIFNKDWEDNALGFLLGYQDKDFGADSFYSNLYKEEEEHTETLLMKTSLDTDLETYKLKNSIFLRRHHDRFLLNRNNPGFSQNTHTTYSYGMHSSINWPIKYGDIESGFEIERDKIDSTNLGKNTRMNEACFLGFRPRLENRWESINRFRIDHFQNWSYQNSFDAGLCYWLIDDKFRIKGSYSHAFRGPSFTELYYSDAANKGNSDLGLEKSDNYSIGCETSYNNLKIAGEAFLRRVKDLIDWTRPTINDIWQASNLGKVDFKGIELRVGPFSYTYMEADKEDLGLLSKYSLDILKHQLMLNLAHDIYGIKINWQLSYNERKYGETYFIGNISMVKVFQKNLISLEPFIKIDNFTDTEYSEIAGVIQPGRWTQAGIKIKW